ncbi:hypothetical protein PHET_10138 [Paragonimus heterotremus]|uniref:Uncharacterized protein n=1 Tax=Paragonimus heterotremus TaxID=100268 RepID=A0A8J4WE96_9TREM|nr:hypothetical protein PHET_10138 [Paragonimus heterotremus]
MRLIPAAFSLVSLPLCWSIRYSRTVESRRQQRIEQKARLPVDMHLPLVDTDRQVTALLITYSVCILILIANLTLIIVLDKSALRAVRRFFCFCCCLIYGLGRFWNNRVDGELFVDDNDSGDEFCCFKLTESVRQRRPVMLNSYQQQKRTEGMTGLLGDDERSVSTSKISRGYSGYSMAPISLSRNYKQKDNTLQVRLEFLADLAAYMHARAAQQLLSETSSSSEEDSNLSQTSQLTQKTFDDLRGISPKRVDNLGSLDNIPASK